ncbi:MAG: tetratricopeptide repeat protein [Bacteroidota bacterium]
MSKLFAIAFILLLPFTGSAAPPDYTTQWRAGVAAYEQKSYDSAAYYFEQIAAAKPGNPELYFNLGNVYYRLNRIAPAVLNYERALKVNPGYREAKDNLTLARNRISNHIAPAEDIFFISWWKSMTRADRAGTWAVLTLVIFCLIIVSMLARRFSRLGRSIPVQVPGVLGFVCLCFFVLAFISATNSYQHNTAVVMENDTPLLNNAQKGKQLALIPEGTTVKILNIDGPWMEVSLPDGRSGWVQQQSLSLI